MRLPGYDGRNKTFFFYAFEGLKSGIPVSSGERAPTDLERAGDFSQSGAIIYDPLNTVNGVPQPFPGNRIPANRMDPVAVNLLKYMVTPNTTPDATLNNFFSREQLALRHLHVGHHPRRSQLRRQQPLLRALRPQRPPRDARQERPRRGGAHGRLSPPLEQRAQRGPELHVRADAAVERARRLDAPPPAGHQRRGRRGRIRHGLARLPAHATPARCRRGSRRSASTTTPAPRSARAAARTVRATTSTCRKS